MIIMAHIPHAGGTWTVEQLQRSGYQPRNVEDRDKANSLTLWIGLAHGQQKDIEQLRSTVPDVPVIVPVRHPARLQRAYELRNKTLKQLERELIAAREILNGSNRAYCLPIDNPYSLATTWQRLCVSLGKKVKMDNREIVRSKHATWKIDPDQVELFPMIEDAGRWLLEGVYAW